ncbi:dTMP kinase [Chlamydiifrater phoenicopteri]|uniref:dTMP kinase n=1 Tax=Chlamydiifrater phoenicopteri TaxID=2681469 RepID=UPI001BCBD0E3|nr:dTMP kinase [Chlamydiifrater phoenicopteri]
MFISIEGGEGCGKSTLAASLSDYLSKEGAEVVCTREPGGTSLGEELRNLLLTNHSFSPNSVTELMLFLAARSEHIQKVILPALRENKIVICERFHDSTIVYQGFAGELDMEYVSNLCNNFMGENTLEPHLTFLLDIPVEDGLKRKRSQKELDRFERKNIAYHEKVRKGFLIQAERFPERIKVLDATLGKQELFETTLSYIPSPFLL